MQGLQGEKRKADDEVAGSLIKRAKDSTDLISTTSSNGAGAVIRKVERTSALHSPIMLLTGHQSEVLSCKFSPNGENLASASFDRSILLWKTYGECENYMQMTGHSGAILEVQWSRDGSTIFSASTDKTLGVWDANTGLRLRKLKGHGSFVNTVSVARRGAELLASGADDNTIRLWDLRSKHPVKTIEERFQVTATTWNEDASMLFSGGIDNEVKAWDMRKHEIVYTMPGHLDTITGLRVSPDGNSLLSNAMDNTARIWDVKPFSAGSSRLLKIFEGAPHGMEKHLLKPCWSNDGEFIAAGSADRSVVIWDVSTRRIVYKLPGHKGCVTEVDWHPKEPIIVSSSNDKNLFLGELNPNEVKTF
ncbi:U5 small nuclear ribonucleoprotein [Phlyctochytrium planicorne]|nr:U5 small nuclear ribonucleoprotein [Phlyctochytrium planicorne]